jgi:hypothetical protein
MGIIDKSSHIPDIVFCVVVAGFLLNAAGVFRGGKKQSSPVKSPMAPLQTGDSATAEAGSKPESAAALASPTGSPSGSPAGSPTSEEAAARKRKEREPVPRHRLHPSANALPPGTVPKEADKIEEKVEKIVGAGGQAVPVKEGGGGKKEE